MAGILKSTYTWTALLLGATLLWTSGCNSGGSPQAPPIDPPVDPPVIPPGGGEVPDFRITSVALPEWYSTLTVVPEVDVTGTVASWSWDFGTGALPATSTEALPTVTLQAPGDYTGTLTIRDAAGHAATLDFTYHVLTPAPPSIVDITPIGIAGAEHTEATFTATLAGGPADSWHWNFADGALPATIDAESPQITLQDVGTYTGTLEVCGPFGCSPVREFRYEARFSIFEWTEVGFPVRTEAAVVRTAADGTVVVVFSDIGATEDEFLLRLGTATEQGAVVGGDAWTMRTLATSERPFDKINVAIDGDLVWVISDGAGPSFYQPQMLRTRLGSTTTEHIALPNCTYIYYPEPGYYSFPHTATPLMAIEGRVYFVLGVREGHLAPHKLFSMSTTETVLPAPLLTFPSNWWVINVDLRLMDDELYLAMGRYAFAPDTRGALLAGWLEGDPFSASGTWHLTEVDNAATEVTETAIIPTSTGLLIWYGAYHSTIQVTSEGDIFPHTEPIDYAVRQAWTTNREFTSPNEWVQSRRDDLPASRDTEAFLIRDRPLLIAGPTARNIGFGFFPVRGLSDQTEEMNWQGSSELLGHKRLNMMTAGAAADGAWICAVDYEGASCSQGNSGTSCDWYDPRLRLGKMRLK